MKTRCHSSQLIRPLAVVCGVFSVIMLIYSLHRVSDVEETKDSAQEELSQVVQSMKQLEGKSGELSTKQVNTGNVQSEQRKPSPQKIYLPSSNEDHLTKLSEEITIVTMYFNIGEFQKGEGSDIFTPKLYHRWMKIFALVENPVIAFFDNEKDKEYFENLRMRFGPKHTKAILIKRDQLWAFSLLKDITRIFKQQGYPKHHPNTVVPEYSCAMHAKYELMEIATKANYFHTRYFAWLDVGLFRSEVSSDDLPFFNIWLPPDFNVSTVAYTEVSQRIPKYTAMAIVFSNAVWVCGCFFIGEVNVMTRLSQQYMRVTKLLIQNQNLMSTDQQVLYILYNWGKPSVGIQTYRSTDSKYNSWFYLGYLCKEQGDLKKNGMLKTQSPQHIA